MFNQDQTINYIHDCKHFYQTHKHLISSNAYSISTYSTKNRVLQYYLYININIYKVVISICFLFGCPIITHEPMDQFASTFL